MAWVVLAVPKEWDALDRGRGRGRRKSRGRGTISDLHTYHHALQEAIFYGTNIKWFCDTCATLTSSLR